MNRFLFLFTGLCLAAACLTGCGDQPDDAAAEIPPGSVMLHDGKIVPIVDDESELTETESGYLWSFHDGEYSMTFPKEWESRFLIRGTTVYCLACFERGTSSSSLFSVEYRPAEDVGAKKPTPELILGVSGDEFLCAVYPRRTEPSNGVLRREYEAMIADCDAVIHSAAEKNDDARLPLATEHYIPADGKINSELFGSWKLQSSKNGRLGETMVFDPETGILTYNGEDGVRTGSCLFNIYAATYDANTQTNWGDAALVFLDGTVYYATYYETSPRTLEFDAVVQQSERKDLLKGTVFAEQIKPVVIQ